MHIKNTHHSYGLISKGFHWLIAFLVLIQLAIIGYREWFIPKGSPLKGELMGVWHKPIGVIILILVPLAFLWKMANPHPSFPLKMKPAEQFAAHVLHALLSLIVLIMAGSGFIMSTASGYAVNFFGWYTLPLLIEKNKALANTAHEIHEWLPYFLLFLLVVHIAAALKHHFIDKDNILKRMLPGS